MISNPSSHGFSLIEMLVVLFIAALGLSLVGPNVIKTYEKVSSRRETQKMIDLIESFKTKAFVRNELYEVDLEGHSMKIPKQNFAIVFDSIRFEEQKFRINSNGFSNIHEFVYYAGSKKHTLLLDK